MATYKIDLTVELEAKNIDEVEDLLDGIESDKVKIVFEAPHLSNPDDYPE